MIFSYRRRVASRRKRGPCTTRLTQLRPKDAPRRRRITRLASADAQQALERIQASSLLAEGKVCLMSLDAIRDRLGPRWDARRDRVYDHAHQSMRKALGPHCFFLRVSETDFLVAQPSVGRIAGQAGCLNCLRDVLTYFLGEALLADIVVHEVTSLAEGRIGAQTLDPAAVDAEAPALPQAAVSPRRAPETASPDLEGVMSLDRWTPFVAHDGARLRASCQLEPVIQLKTYGRIGYRLRRRILTLPAETPLSRADQLKLTSGDIERIDFATLARGLNRIEQEPESARQPSLILPVSFATLSSKRGRATLAEFFRAAQENVQRGLICEVCDIEGVPPSTMLAVTSLMRPFCLFMIGRLAAPPVNGPFGAGGHRPAGRLDRAPPRCGLGHRLRRLRQEPRRRRQAGGARGDDLWRRRPPPGGDRQPARRDPGIFRGGPAQAAGRRRTVRPTGLIGRRKRSNPIAP